MVADKVSDVTLTWRGFVLYAGSVPIGKVFSVLRKTSDRPVWVWKLGIGEDGDYLFNKEKDAQASLKEAAFQMLGEKHYRDRTA